MERWGDAEGGWLPFADGERRAVCPMCGAEEPVGGRRRFARRVACVECGEAYELPGDAEAPVVGPERPFWSDQFRVMAALEDDPFDDSALAAIDPLMLAIVSGFAMFVLSVVFVATAG